MMVHNICFHLEIRKIISELSSIPSYLKLCFHQYYGALVALKVKCWPTYPAAPAGGGNFANCKQGSTAHSLLFSRSNGPDTTEILLKRM